MLPREARMRRGEDFRLAMRTGNRAGSRLLAVHCACATAGDRRGRMVPAPQSRVGFVVSRAVGSAVVRNRVKRRLRELMRVRLAALPEGCLLVVRAHPAAAGARQADLAADLDLALGRLPRRQVGALRRE
ncbi:MAG: ribonuclease P protein component [Nocardiopsaceae bacterium]|nr:ribonuclease P protein component [Nocardiopsaceae bacterium]